MQRGRGRGAIHGRQAGVPVTPGRRPTTRCATTPRKRAGRRSKCAHERCFYVSCSRTDLQANARVGSRHGNQLHGSVQGGGFVVSSSRMAALLTALLLCVVAAARGACPAVRTPFACGDALLAHAACGSWGSGLHVGGPLCSCPRSRCGAFAVGRCFLRCALCGGGGGDTERRLG
jgi:hypothetical protein